MVQERRNKIPNTIAVNVLHIDKVENNTYIHYNNLYGHALVQKNLPLGYEIYNLVDSSFVIITN